MTRAQPVWNIPGNLSDLVDADEGEMWEDNRWSPILLTAMKGTVYRGRKIPLAWQIEFEPEGPEFEKGNKKLEELGLDQDGYGWANLISSAARKYHPKLAEELQFGDTEEVACVVWVESEESCRLLMELVWSLIHI